MELLIKNTKLTITERDIDFVRKLSYGDRPNDIAEEYGLSRRTIEFHLDSLRRKTHCDTLPQLVALFFRNDLIS